MAEPERLALRLDGFEGPLDLLLDLARAQKVDLATISILALVEQYLAVIEDARRIRLELAADWLVMAAWLAWLKSRLLLPADERPEAEAEAAGDLLSLRLAALDTIRRAAAWLGARPLLGQDVFARGVTEDFTEIDRSGLAADTSGLIRAFLTAIRRGQASRVYVPRPMTFWSVQQALARLEQLIGAMPDWATLEAFLPPLSEPTPLARRRRALLHPGRGAGTGPHWPTCAAPGGRLWADRAGTGMSEADMEDWLRLAEAMLFAAAEPLPIAALGRLLPDEAEPEAVLAALRLRYAGRGVEPVEVAGGWQFRTAPDLAPRLKRVVSVPRRLPRAAMETLAIIAYHQPVTRPEIEDMRGASLAQTTLDALLEANLIEAKGQRESPGRPTLWGTTRQFLSQFSLGSIRDLPKPEDITTS